MRVAILSLVLFVAGAGSAGAADFEYRHLPEEPKAPRIILVPRDVPVTVLLVHFAAGAVTDGSSPGLTRLSQHMMLRSNRRLPHKTLLEELHASAATLTMETGIHGSHFLLVAPREEFAALSKKVLDLTLAPQLVLSGLDEAVELTAQDSRDLPEAADVVQDFARALTQDWRFQNDRYGDRSSLEAITKVHLKHHLSGPLSAANATIIAAGSFDTEAFEKLVAKYRGGRRVAFVKPRLTLPIATRALARSPVHVLGYSVPLTTARDRAVLYLLAAVLDDTVQKELRERGLGYAFLAMPTHRSWLDAITLILPARGEPSVNLRALLSRRVAAVREGKVDEETFERNRRHVANRLRALDDDVEQLARELATVDADPAWTSTETLLAVESLPYEEFTETARQWLHEDARYEIDFLPPSTAQSGPRPTRRSRSSR